MEKITGEGSRWRTMENRSYSICAEEGVEKEPEGLIRRE